MPYTLPYNEVDGLIASGTQMQANLTALLNAVNALSNSNSITRAQLLNTTAGVFLGSLSAGQVQDLTPAQAATLLPTFTATLKGFAPPSGGGTTAYLRADGTWAIPPGGGGVVPTGTGFPHITAGAQDAAALTATQTTALLDAFTSTTKGLAPASGGGSVNFLRADGSWATPPAGGGSAGSVNGGAANSTFTVPAAPTNSAIPTISGTLAPGNVLTATTGTWTNSPAIFDEQWQRSGTNVGTDSVYYQLTAADAGATMTVAVTATNPTSSATATSAATGTVSATATPLVLNFVSGFYSAAGTFYALSSMPGYSYARTGTELEQNGTAVPVSFAANTPAIISGVGYYSRAATTNSLLQSNALDSSPWVTSNATIVPNVAAAIDGNITADKYQEANATVSPLTYQAFTDFSTTTISAYLQANGRRYAFLRMNPSPGEYCFVVFDLQAGTVTSTQKSGTLHSTATGYIYNCGGGIYRCVMVYTKTTPATNYLCLNLSDVAVPTPSNSNGEYAYTGNGSNGVNFSHIQAMSGSYPLGGPLLPTTTATASIGAAALAVGVANGSYTATYTFDDNSTQTIATTIAAGSFAMPVAPTTLNRALVKSVSLA